MRFRNRGGNRSEVGDASSTKTGKGPQFLSLVALAAVTTSCGGTDSTGANVSPFGSRAWPPIRYRLTVEVDTPQGLRRGSSVIEINIRQASKNSIPTPSYTSTRVRGEAAMVELPGGRTLFALLRSDEDAGWAGRALDYVIARQSDEHSIATPDYVGEGIRELIELKGVRALPRWVDLSTAPGDRRSGYPMLVTFRDNRIPSSIEKVDPDDLSESFGKGFILRQITVERTTTPIGSEVQKKLSWLSEYRGKHFDGSSSISTDYSAPLKSTMTPGFFSSEIYK